MIKYDSKTLIENTSNGANEICALDSTRFIVVYNIVNTLYARIGTNTNGVLTFGSRYTLTDSYSAPPGILGVTLINTDKVAIGFMNDSLVYNHVCCSISGNIITVGTINTYSAGAIYLDTYQHAVVKLRNDYFATAFRYRASPNNVGITTFSVSGTTITALNNFATGVVNCPYFALEFIETDKFVFVYIDSADANKGKSKVVTFDGSNLTFNTANTFSNSNNVGIALAMYDTNKLYINTTAGGINSGYNGVLSGTSITWDTTGVDTNLNNRGFIASGNKNIALISDTYPLATHCKGNSKVCAPVVDIDPSGNVNYYTRICYLPGTKYFIATYASLYAQALTISSSGSNILTNFLN